MPHYNCEICCFSSKIKTNYLQHLKTKKHIKNVKNYGLIINNSLQNPPKPSKNPPKPSKNPPKPSDFGGKKCTNIFERTCLENPYRFEKIGDSEMFYCTYCSKSFSRQDNLKRHMNYRCKDKYKDRDESIFKQLYEKEVKEKELVMEEHKRHMEKLLDKVGHTTITNNNCNNTQTNNQTNVQLNNYGQENLAMLTDKYMRKMIIYPYTAIPKLIKKIHFNDKFPENRNIRMLNKKDNKLQIRNNNKWEYVNKKETLENLIHDKNYQLDKYFEENRDTFECKYQNRFDGFQEKIGHEDRMLNKTVNTDTELIFWNNM